MNKTDKIYHKNITLEQAISGGSFFMHLDIGKKIKVNIHPGVNNGQIIRLKNLGELGNPGIKRDIFIELKVLDHPLYKIIGRDLSAALVLTPAEAKVGCTKPMPGPDGKKLQITVPANSKQGEIIIMENAGIRVDDIIGSIHFKILIEDVTAFKTGYESFLSPDEKNNLN